MSKIWSFRVQGMRKEELDMEVRLAATQALFNALEFASTNFSNETERNYLMQARAHAASAALRRSCCTTPALQRGWLTWGVGCRSSARRRSASP